MKKPPSPGRIENAERVLRELAELGPEGALPGWTFGDGAQLTLAAGILERTRAGMLDLRGTVNERTGRLWGAR